MTAEELAVDIYEECESGLYIDDGESIVLDACAPDPGPSGCAAVACRAQANLCLAHRFLEMSSSVAPVELPGEGPDGETRTLPPQSADARTGLSEFALRSAKAAVFLSTIGLEGPAELAGSASQYCSPLQRDTLVSTVDGLTAYESLSLSLVEGLAVTDEAQVLAVRGNTAAADAELSLEPSRRRAVETAYLAPVLSRGRAATLLVGNLQQDQNAEPQPMRVLQGDVPFTQSRLSSSALIALDTIRAAAPPLEYVEADVDLMLTGASDSVRARLIDRYQVQESFFPTDTDGFLDALGLTRTDMEDARAWMVDEARSFPRGSDVPAEPIRLSPNPDGTPRETQYDRWSVTAQSAAQPPAAYWFARATVTPDAPNHDFAITADGHPVPNLQFAVTGTPHLKEYSYTVAARVLRERGMGDGDAVSETLAHVLANPDGARARGLLHYDSGVAAGTTPSASLRAYVDDPNHVALVQSGQGLICATTGFLENQPCDVSDFLIPGGASDVAPADTTFSHYVEWDLSGHLPESGDLDDEDNLLFVLRTTATSAPPGDPVPPPPGGGTDGPGGAAATLTLIGAETVIATSLNNCALSPDACDQVYDHVIPDTPEQLMEAVEDATAQRTPPPGSTTDHDPDPVNHCSGLDTDFKLPLENSLALPADSDPLESSWRSYLTLAREAAAQADGLGEQLLSETLSAELRAESAMLEIEAACGSAVDLDLLDRDGEFFDMMGMADAPMVAGPCSTDGTCGGDYICRSGTCILDVVGALESSPGLPSELARLETCVGEDALVPLVSLGDSTLCVWRNRDNPNELCGGPFDRDCPFELSAVADETTPSCEDLQGAAGYPGVDSPQRLVTVDVNLGVFESDPTSPPPTSNGADELCRAIRTARMPAEDVPRTENERFVMQNERVFDVQNVQRAARALGFESLGQGYGTLIVGDGRFSTGSPTSGPSLSWPCSPAGPPIDCTTLSPLLQAERGVFCGPTIDCTSETARDTWAVEMQRAVIAAQHFAKVAPAAPLRLPGTGFSDVPGLDRETTVSSNVVGPSGDPVRVVAGFYQSDDGGTFQWSRAGDLNLNFLLSAPSYTVNDAEAYQFFRNRARGGAVGLTGSDTYASFIIDRQDDAAVFTEIPGWFTAYQATGRFDPALVGPYFDPRNASNWPVVQGGGGGATVTYTQAWDAFELLCTASNSDRPISCGEPPEVRSPRDMAALRDFMGCAAQRVEESGRRMVFANVPQQVVDVIQSSSSFGAAPAVGGDYGAGVTRLREGMLAFRDIPQALAHELRQFANDLERVERTMEILDLGRELDRLALIGTISNQITSCVVAAANVSSNGIMGVAGGVISAAATCANAGVQIAMAVKSSNTMGEINNLEQQQALGELQQLFNERSRQMELLFERLSAARENIDGGLVGIESAQRRARSALARGLLLDSDEAGRQYRVNRIMRRRLNTLSIRYEEAKSRAIKFAFLARQAVEQRIGFPLEELTGLPLVEDPAGWIDEVCTLDGIDYERIRSSGLASDFQDFSNGYIGDYVRDLEALVESYRLVHPFSDGEDTAVISLRDDLLNVRARCQLPGPNLLRYSSQLDSPGAGWTPEQCEPIPDPVTGELEVLNCAVALPVPVSAVLDPTLPADEPQPAVHRVIFGTGVPSEPSSFRWTVDQRSSLGQNVELSGGRRYRLSFYGNADGASPSEAVRVLAPDGTTVGGSVSFDSLGVTVGGGAQGRYWLFFDTPRDVENPVYRVAVQPVGLVDGEDPAGQSVYVGGFMLEDVSGTVIGRSEAALAESDPETLAFYDPSRHPPRPYTSTSTAAQKCDPGFDDGNIGGGVAVRRA